MRGVYSITNKRTCKKYIGESFDIERRWIQHMDDLRNGIHHNHKLQKDWVKYGFDNFEFRVEYSIDKEKRPYQDIPYKVECFLLYMENEFMNNCISEKLYNSERTMGKVLSGGKKLFSQPQNITLSDISKYIEKLNITKGESFFTSQIKESVKQNELENAILTQNECFKDLYEMGLYSLQDFVLDHMGKARLKCNRNIHI